MIKRFSSLFAGHIDLGDMGQHATPPNERRYDNDALATVFDKSTALAQCMDCLLYTSPSPRDRTRSRMPSSA